METPSGQPRDDKGPEEPRQEAIERIFNEAILLPASERPEFVSRACRHPDMAEEILELLRYDDEGAASDLDTGSLVGARIGGCRIVRRIGMGGMGTVFEAVEEETGRRVALKLLGPAIAASGSLRRFRREATLMSRIEHPGIARVYSSGVHRVALADGLPVTGFFPFLVMQYVDGAVALSDYCSSKGLSVRARLELLAEVLDAIAFGHVLGIVHCDLKPQNILVGSDGKPVVIDFGIARAVGPHEPGAAHAPTGESAGTPRYMSPEQLFGQSALIDARTDVFALGCLLFETLTGAHPYGLSRDVSAAEASRIVGSTDPKRLGSADRALRGDLEVIVAKALHRDPDMRYRDAAALAQDLRRFLSRQPIAARTPTIAYRATRFVQRNPWSFGWGCAAAIGLTAFSVFTLVLAAEARQSRDLSALRAAQYALEVLDFSAAREALREIPVGRRDFTWHAIWSRAAGWSREVEFGSPGAHIYDVESARSGKVFVAASGGAVAIVQADESGATRIVEDPRPGGSQEVLSFDVDSEATRAAIGSMGQAPIVLDLDDGSIAWEGPAPDRWFTAVALSPDGSRVFHCPPDGPLSLTEIGDSPDAHRVLRTRPIGGYVRSIDCSPDGQRLALGVEPATLVLLDAVSLEELWRAPLSGSRDVPDVRFTAEGGFVCATAFSGRTEVFSLEGSRVAEVPGSALGEVSSYAGEISPDGAWIACGAMDRCPRLVETSSGRSYRLPGHDGQVWSVAWSRDGAVLATVGATMRLWDASRFDPQGSSLVGDPCSGIWMSSCGSLAATNRPSARRTVVFDTCTAKELGGFDGLAAAVALDAPRSRVAALGPDGLAAYERRDGRFQLLWKLSVDALRAARLSPTGTLAWFDDGRLAVASGCEALVALDGSSGRELGRAPLDAIDRSNPVIAEPGFITSLRPFGPAEIIGATPRSPGYFRWDGSVLEHAPPQDGQLPYRRRCAAVGGALMVTGDIDGTIRLIDARSLQETGRCAALSAACVAIAVRPQGDCIAAASTDRRLALVDPRTGDRIVRIPLPDVASELRFAADGGELAIGLAGGRVIRLLGRELER